MRSTFTGVRDEALGHLRRLRAAAGREDEREGAVVTHLLDDLERLREVLLGLAGEADDDVGRERDVGNVLADQRHAIEVALAVVGPPHRLQDRGSSPTAAAGGCARRARGSSACARMTSSRMSFGCGLV